MHFQCYPANCPPPSQCSTGAHTERIAATQYHVLYGGHWLPPSSGVSGSSTCWVSCRLFFCRDSGFSACWVSCWPCQLYRWSLLWRQLPCWISLCARFAEPRVGKCELRGWKKTGEAIGTANTFIFSWLTQQPSSRRTIFSPFVADSTDISVMPQ